MNWCTNIYIRYIGYAVMQSHRPGEPAFPKKKWHAVKHTCSLKCDLSLCRKKLKFEYYSLAMSLYPMSIWVLFACDVIVPNVKSANQQISKSANQQISRPANQQISRPANQSDQQISIPANQPINQTSKSADQQIMQTSRPANHQISKSANQADQQISKSANQADQ